MPSVPQTSSTFAPLPKPAWIRAPVPQGKRYLWIQEQARTLNLHTVCEEARCPNIGECWRGGTATFMLLGRTCTRGCRFCSVETHKRPPPLDPLEPVNIAETIAKMGLNYVVLTSVNRDDLPDQGAQHFAETIRRTQLACADLLIETLIPDFQGLRAPLETIAEARPAVLAHNLETVERLTPQVRDPRASFEQSLEVLRNAKRIHPAWKTKSSLMLGLGEREEEVLQAMRALRAADVDFLTLGQYLQPHRRKLPVREYIHPDRFRDLEQAGLEMGFAYVAAGPLVRSSYRAAEYYIAQELHTAAPQPVR